MKSYKKLAVKSQSELITTILLILLAVSIIVIVSAFLMPFIKNQISKSDCFSVIDKIGIRNNPSYTCYDTSVSKLRVQIYMEDIQNKISSFIIEAGGAETKSVEVINNTAQDSTLCMYDKSQPNSCAPAPRKIEFPLKNEERTYVISGLTAKPDVIRAYLKMKTGETCDASDILIEVPDCLLG